MVANLAGGAGFERGAEVQRKLMAKEVLVNPCIGAAPLGAPQQAAIKRTGFGKVGDVIGEVKD